MFILFQGHMQVSGSMGGGGGARHSYLYKDGNKRHFPDAFSVYIHKKHQESACIVNMILRGSGGHPPQPPFFHKLLPVHE